MVGIILGREMLYKVEGFVRYGVCSFYIFMDIFFILKIIVEIWMGNCCCGVIL